MPYRTDPETGKTFFIDPTLMGCRTAEDEKFAKDDFIALVERRAGILAARRPLTARERDHNDYLLGYRAVAGKVFCIGCENRSRPDVEVDDQCGQPLQPLESYQGVMPSDVVRCAYCNRMNTEKAKFCNSCANPINVKPIESKSKGSRPRAATPPQRRFQKSAPTSSRQPDLASLPFGTQLVARETFTFKTQAGRVSKVTKGITFVAKDSEAYAAKPSAFAFV